MAEIPTAEMDKETILSLEAEVKEHQQKTFVTLSKFWSLMVGGGGGGGWVNLLKKGNLWGKSFFQTMLYEALKISEKWYLLM